MVKQLVQEYEVPEGFVYNYDTGKWLKYSLTQGEITDCPSWSESINVDLDLLVKKQPIQN